MKSSLANPHQRPTSRAFADYEQRFPLGQTLAAQMDEKIRKQRAQEALTASQLIDKP